jgi:hypothetical protein
MAMACRGNGMKNMQNRINLINSKKHTQSRMPNSRICPCVASVLQDFLPIVSAFKCLIWCKVNTQVNPGFGCVCRPEIFIGALMHEI